jgi:16S rRNA U1498 N3-methylase RsmE
MGFKPVHFEGTILRTETAALFAVAAVKTILMEKAAWTLSK